MNRFFSGRPYLRRPFTSLLASWMLGAITQLAYAQAVSSVRLDPQPTLRAAQADTPVPKARYRSVFADLPTGVEQTSLDWKKANADVGQFKRGYPDLLKWEQERARQKAAATNSLPSTAAKP